MTTIILIAIFIIDIIIYLITITINIFLFSPIIINKDFNILINIYPLKFN